MSVSLLNLLLGFPALSITILRRRRRRRLLVESGLKAKKTVAPIRFDDFIGTPKGFVFTFLPARSSNNVNNANCGFSFFCPGRLGSFSCQS